jgi:penicillin-binding protein 1C
MAGDARVRARRTVVSPATAFWISDILSDDNAREYIFGRGGSLEFPFGVAVKTGTSQAYHDNWTVGYTRGVTVGVWVGNFDRTPLRSSTGVTGAAPIFHAVMMAVTRRRHGSAGVEHLPDVTIVAAPEGLPEREICALSGMPANGWCPSRQRERLPHADDPPCSWHHLSDDGVITIWPPKYREWARANGLLDASRRSIAAAAVRPPRSPATARAPLEIVNPPTGATYFIDPTLRREFQTLGLRVVTSTPGTIEWKINDRPLGRSSSDAALDWPLAPGTHRIAARDERGHVAEASVVVK